MARQDFYDDPSIYDILHTPGTASEVDGLERISLRFAPGRPERHVWLEPACGTARHLRVAAGRGRRVMGFDLSPAMIAYARARLASLGLAGRAELFVADMASFETPRRAHFAFNMINTIRHLPSDRALRDHLAAVGASLVPGGIYAVGLGFTDPREQPSEDVWEAARGRCRVRQVVQYLPPPSGSRRERVISHLEVVRPGSSRHIDSTYDLRTYTRAQWRRVVAGSPLVEEAVVGEHGRLVESDGYAIRILRRPR